MFRKAMLAAVVIVAQMPAEKLVINDPARIVADVYRHYIKAQSTRSDYTAPENIYTARLSKLIRDDRKRAKGEVGCLDFDFWVNGQDWKITKPDVTRGTKSEDRWEVVAKFVNLDSPEEIHFDFRKMEGRWLLDDVRSVKEPRWTLSDLLKCAH